MEQQKKKIITDGRLAWIIILAILIIDQVIKILVKTNMTLGESIHITDWFYINFIENNGMAFGLTFVNKLFLSLLRLVAIAAIGWFIWQVVRQKGRRRFVVILSMILAGAAGNIFDSMFYGLIFTDSTPWSVSFLVPFGQGYSSFLMGRVVDMFYFPLIVGHFPDWFPFWGGEQFIFFSPVFNFADACVTMGVLFIFLFCRKDFEGIGDVVNRGLGRDKKQESDGKAKEGTPDKPESQGHDGSQTSDKAPTDPKETKETVAPKAATTSKSGGKAMGMLLLLGVFALWGCKPSVPREYIQPDELQDILYDYHVADGVARSQGGDYASQVVALRTSILKKHGITQAHFDSSMVYYMRHADRLHSIYEDLSDRLQEDAKALGASASDMVLVGGSLSDADTVNIWRAQTSMVLFPTAPYNSFSFEIKPDSSFHPGDKLLLRFSSNFIFQDGMRDGVACLAVTYKNDSVASRTMHINSASNFTLQTDDNDSLGLKSIRGFFLLAKSQSANSSMTTLQLMSIYDVKLIRSRTHYKKPVPSAAASGDSSRQVSPQNGTPQPAPPTRNGVNTPPRPVPQNLDERQIPVPPTNAGQRPNPATP
jgi:signal peptidase II